MGEQQLPEGTTLIQPLLAVCRPAAVVGCIRSVVVDAVKRQSLGGLAHVAQECSEVSAPFVAHVNTPGPVISELAVVRVITPAFRIPPRQVRLTETSLGVMAVAIAYAFTPAFFFKASATLGMPSNEIALGDGGQVTAITSAEPLHREPFVRWSHRGVWASLQNQQSAKAGAGQLAENTGHV